MSGRGRSFGANVLISFGFTFLLAGMSFGNSVIVARWVGAEGRGLYALAVAALGVAIPIATAGLGYASTWAIGQKQELRDVVSLNHLWFGGLLTLGWALAGGLWVAFGGLPDLEWALVGLAVLVTLPAAVYSDNARGVLLGLNRVVGYNTVQLANVGALMVANLTMLRYGPRAVLATLPVGYWLPALVLLLGHLRWLPRFRIPSRTSRNELLGYGVKASGTYLIEVLLIRLDYLLVTPLIGVVAAGLYSVADQVTLLMAWGGQIAARMMLAESAADADGDRALWKLGLGVRLLIVVVLVGALGFAATGWYLLPLVFGEEFGPSYLGTLILLPAALIRGSTALIGTWLMGRNHLRPVLIAGVAATGVILVGSPVAAWLFGWYGVAAVRVLAVMTQLVLTARAYRSVTGESFRWVLDREDITLLANWVRARLARRRGGDGP